MVSEKIKDLLREIDALKIKVTALQDDYGRIIKGYDDMKDTLDLCPGGRPDGTGIFTPRSWIKWARNQLGYSKECIDRIDAMKYELNDDGFPVCTGEECSKWGQCMPLREAPPVGDICIHGLTDQRERILSVIGKKFQEK